MTDFDAFADDISDHEKAEIVEVFPSERSAVVLVHAESTHDITDILEQHTLAIRCAAKSGGSLSITVRPRGRIHDGTY